LEHTSALSTKEEVIATLTEIQLEIEEIKIDNNVPSGFEPVSKTSAFYEGVSASSKVIQEKINSLKADQEGEE
jgi:FtsZ-binding cell division protein ZapB